MVDPVAPIEPAAAAPSPSPAPVPPAAAPVASAPDSSAAVSAPAAPIAPAVETPTAAPATPAPAVDAPVQPERSFLSKELDKQKPAEPAPAPEGAKPAADASKPEVKPPDVAKPTEAPAPIAWEYTVPETVPLNAEGTLQAKVNFDDAARAKVNSMLEAFSAKPGDKANQQALVDYHIDRLTEQNRQIADFNRNYWNDTRQQWRQRWASDPEIGGSGIETSKAAAARVLDIAMRWNDTSPANKAFHRDVEEAFETTGIGDHPALGRILTRLARFMDESPPPPPNLKPPADIGKPPGRGRLRDRYSNMP